MKKVDFFIFMPVNYLGLDTTIPFLSCLKKPGKNINCIFWNPQSFGLLSSFPAFYKILTEIGSISVIDTTSFYRLFCSYGSVMLRILIASNPRIITEGSTTDKTNIFSTPLRLLSKFKGIFYVIQKYSAPMSFSYIEEYYLSGLNDPEQRRILGKSPGTFEAYSEKSYLGTVLLQSQYEDERADFFGHSKKRLYLGYYKLHKSWSNIVEANPCGGSATLQKEKSFIVNLAKKSGEHYFDSAGTAQILLQETIEHIRKYYKNTLIVLKLKPYKMANATNDWFKSFVTESKDERLVIDDTPVAFMAPKTIVALFTVPSTAYIDFVINEVPCITHARYGKNYHKVHPKGEYLSDFGVLKTSTIEELDKAISTVKDGTFNVMTRDSLKQHLAHIDDESTFEML